MLGRDVRILQGTSFQNLLGISFKTCRGKLCIISDQSPIGKSLIGNRKGDIVDVQLPTGKVLQLKILSIAKSK